MTTILTGYVVRETEKAIAVVRLPLGPDMKPLWLPRKKVATLTEVDGYSPSVQLAGESIRRLGTPVVIEVESTFLAKVGA